MSAAVAEPSFLDNPEYVGLTDFHPRPDQPERFDEQTAFFECKSPGVAFLIGGNGAGTTETACGKLSKFLLFDQPPPRRDTPFYVISSTYELVCKVLWKEKLYGHGHIPSCEVDWERVAWYSSKDGWPFRVPLKEWPGRPGKNWTLEFKSYEQGRHSFESAAIGGFLFSEQFPWPILEEVLIRCREYSFPGAKMCEFTPVDPIMSAPLEQMIDDDELPPGWKVFRANTDCALEAGHVQQQWYEEAFATVSDDMQDVRKIGAFASYKGRIYPRFSKIHLTAEPLEKLLVPGMSHRRGLDWGFGPDNAFCCVWGAKNGAGDWLIYDEYYSTDDRRTVHEHLKAIADKTLWPRNNSCYGVTYADPSDPGNLRIASRFSQYQDGYENFNMQAASNRVHEGIDLVKWLMQTNANGKPRLIVQKEKCPKLVEQLRKYRWRAGSERGLNPTDARPEPLKKDDHACDALRYLVFSDANQIGITPEGVRKTQRYRDYGIQFKRNE